MHEDFHSSWPVIGWHQIHVFCINTISTFTWSSYYLLKQTVFMFTRVAEENTLAVHLMSHSRWWWWGGSSKSKRLMGSLRNFSRVCFKGLSQAAFLEILPFSFQNQYQCCLSLDNHPEDLITQSTFIFVDVFRGHDVEPSLRSDSCMNISVWL